MKIRSTFPAFLLLFLTPTLALCQGPYWGMTASGGANDIGTIYSITEGGTFTTHYSMDRVVGSGPKSDMLLAPNGKYYGVTEFGGSSGDGILFEYDPVTSAYTVKVEFNGTNGSRPLRGLTRGRNGRYYGMTVAGGTGGGGTLFEYNLATNALLTRINFTGAGAGTNGGSPLSRLEPNAAASVLYGTTQTGGANARGTVFSYAIPASGGAGTGIIRLHDFTPVGPGNTGFNPASGVRFSSNLLYGVTPSGGSGGFGVLYSLTTSVPYTYTVLHNFTTADVIGTGPVAEPVVANGKVFGICTGNPSGLNTIFSYTIAGGAMAKVLDLNATTGFGALGGMIVGMNGTLYGMMRAGGVSGNGVIYSLNPTTNAYTVLSDLGSEGIQSPYARLLEVSSGVFVATSQNGGTGSAGTLFRYSSGTGLTILVPFNFSNGYSPTGKMLRASNGLFYGMCSNGGVNGKGVLFSFDKATNTYTRLVDLSTASGSFPEGDLVEVAGKLYGLCASDGANGVGTLFEYAIATQAFVKKIDLGGVLGSSPKAGLLLASDGKLYGVTSIGGGLGNGTLFDYVPATNTLTVRHALSASNGISPLGTLMQATNGKLYGTCSTGGAFGDGTLFSFDPVTNTYSVLQDLFDTFNGGTPSGDLVQAADGLIYGTAATGGGFLAGAIFSYDPVNAIFNVVHDVDQTTSTEGDLSYSNLLQGVDGRLYGTCSAGGTNGFGTLFRVDPVSSAWNVLTHFSGTNGKFPLDGLSRESALVPPATLQVAVKAFLDGPYDENTQSMASTLRLRPEFPLTEPFTAAGFTQVGGGGETISPAVLTVSGSNAIVDWVLLELRSGSDNTSILQTRSALVQSDGDVVATDGTSPVTFNLAAGNYFVAVRHRNHFAALTLNTVALSSTPSALDFTTGTLATYGTNAQRVRGARRTNWAGNVIRDAVVKYTGSSNDRDPILTQIGGILATSTFNGYETEDVNLDGTVKYTGSANDRDIILQTIGGVLATGTRTEQLP